MKTDKRLDAVIMCCTDETAGKLVKSWITYQRTGNVGVLPNELRTFAEHIESHRRAALDRWAERKKRTIV